MWRRIPSIFGTKLSPSYAKSLDFSGRIWVNGNSMTGLSSWSSQGGGRWMQYKRLPGWISIRRSLTQMPLLRLSNTIRRRHTTKLSRKYQAEAARCSSFRKVLSSSTERNRRLLHGDCGFGNLGDESPERTHSPSSSQVLREGSVSAARIEVTSRPFSSVTSIVQSLQSSSGGASRRSRAM